MIFLIIKILTVLFKKNCLFLNLDFHKITMIIFNEKILNIFLIL